MPKRIRVRVDGVTAEGQLFEDRAPRTVAALWSKLPIKDRTIQTRWSGDAWRTENNYELLPDGSPVENVAGQLEAGDIIYYPGYPSKLIKVGIAYGKAQWLAPFMVPIDVALIGKLDDGLDAFVTRCQQIIFEGPLEVELSRIE
jgi:hypothetical protein